MCCATTQRSHHLNLHGPKPYGSRSILTENWPVRFSCTTFSISLFPYCRSIHILITGKGQMDQTRDIVFLFSDAKLVLSIDPKMSFGESFARKLEIGVQRGHRRKCNNQRKGESVNIEFVNVVKIHQNQIQYSEWYFSYGLRADVYTCWTVKQSASVLRAGIRQWTIDDDRRWYERRLKGKYSRFVWRNLRI